MTGHVVAVGGVNLDTLARVTGDPDDRRTVLGTSNPGHTSRTAGGVARNVAENLARLGTPVRLVAAVGDDAVGDALVGDLADLGVDVSGVRHRALPTGSYTAVLDRHGELVVGVADMAATESLAPADLPDGAFAGADWVVLDGNLLPATVDRCLALAAATGVPVALDPVGVAKAARLRVTGPVHTFTPTREELSAFTGTADIGAAVAVAHDRGIDTVWLREGAGGSTIHRPGNAPVRVQLPRAEVVDVTGAGDAMLAGYVHRMLAGSPVVEAARFGAAAAWLTVASPSTVRTDLTAQLVAETLARLDPTREGAR